MQFLNSQNATSRVLQLALIVLLGHGPSLVCAANVGQNSAKPKANSVNPSSFVRTAPFPKWAQALPPVPETKRDDPVVIRLMETQQTIVPVPAVLVSRAVQVNDKTSLGVIGQYGIDYFPAYQKLLLHRVALLRGNQVIDRTASVDVRLLERETQAEEGTYGGAITAKFLLDDVRVGDTLWVTYTIEGQNPVFGTRWSSDFSWDAGTPIELRRLSITHPRQRALTWRQLGDLPAENLQAHVEQIGDLERIQFEQHSIEPVDFEPSAPPEFIPVRFLQFSEYTDWQDVARWADGLFPTVPATPALKSLSQQFDQQPTTEAKTSAALHWVQDQVRYFSVSIGENSHRPQSPDVVIKRRYGDCKDKSYLLISLLREMGIEAHPVLLASESPKVLPKLIPSPKWFDHVIVQLKLDGQTYYVDPTRNGQTASISKLPMVFAGASGLVVDSNSKQLLHLPEVDITEPRFELVEHFDVPGLDADATLEMREIFRSNYAEWARVQYQNMSLVDLKKDVLQLYEKRYQGVTLSGKPELISDDVNNVFEIRAKLNLPKPIEHKEKKYVLSFGTQVMEGTLGIPNKLIRKSPLALPRGKYSGRYRMEVQWPKEVRLTLAPKQSTIDTPYFKLHDEYIFQGRHLSYLMDYRILQDEVPAAEVSELQRQAKRLNEYDEANFSISESSLVGKEDQALKARELDAIQFTQELRTLVKFLDQPKVEVKDIENLCSLVRAYPGVWAIDEARTKSLLRQLKLSLGSKLDSDSLKPCVAQMLLHSGELEASSEMLRSLDNKNDDVKNWQAQAWIRFYLGDLDGALDYMSRYRKEIDKELSGQHDLYAIADEIALRQRSARPLSPELISLASAIPDGPWPRPILAMQLDLISETALLKTIEAYDSYTAELIANDAWFFIGQKRLAAGDENGAKVALNWYRLNGTFSVSYFADAQLELGHLRMADHQTTDGLRAMYAKDEAGAIAKWTEGANLGRADSQYFLGEAYWYGSGVPVDKLKAKQWFELAAKQMHPRATFMLGVIAAEEDAESGKHARAVELFRKAADLGDSFALYSVGHLYETGGIDESGQSDYHKAVEYYEKAAQLHNRKAINALGDMHYYGQGVEKSDQLAVYWYKLGAELGDSDSQVMLGLCFELGRGVAEDKSKALELYRLAAEKDNRAAQNNIGVFYDNGYVVKKDTALAIQWFQKSAQNGFAPAQRRMGYLTRFHLKNGDVVSDPDASLQWFEKAAEQGDLESQLELAKSFAKGLMVKKNLEAAVKYYRMAAEQGSPLAQVKLGVMFYFGDGVSADHVEAAKWYQKAADQGNAWAQNNLASQYESGDGVPQDLVRALDLYRKAAANGEQMALLGLGGMYENGKGMPIDPVMAYMYYHLAAKLGAKDSDAKTYIERRDQYAKKITSEQIRLAEAQAVAWKPAKEISVTGTN